MSRKNWIEVSRPGLATLAGRGGKSCLLFEPIQNSWDEEGTTLVTVDFTPVPKSRLVDMRVVDNSFHGYADLSHSWKVFEASYKMDDPTKRGRFNLGEKLVLANAVNARIITTSGSVVFDERGRRRGRKTTERGTILEARLKINRAELAEMLEMGMMLISPHGIETVINGVPLPERAAIASGEFTLETEIQSDNGGFRDTRRKTMVKIYRPQVNDGIAEKPQLYEMGIPVGVGMDKGIGCPWHVDVSQRVPLSVDRGSVRYRYLRAVEEKAAELMADCMTSDQACQGWVTDALGSTKDDEVVMKLVKQRFGEKAVIQDPSDQEANKRAIDKGYRVIHGRELDRFAWKSVKRAAALEPAGRLFPSGVQVSPDGERPIDRLEWTAEMEKIAEYAGRLSEHVNDVSITVEFYASPNDLNWLACYGGGGFGKTLSFNLRGFQRTIDSRDQEALDRLLIHELAHEKVADHLTDAFSDECCRIGAKLREYTERVWSSWEKVD